jgi:transcriptional regulator with XRE-family HTH domain
MRERPSDVLCRQLQLWRQENGLTVEQLAERVKALGGKLDRVAITKIETRRRRVTLDDALLLAAALNVPPPELFFGLGDGERVEITPKNIVHPDAARRWLAGEDPLITTTQPARVFFSYKEWEYAATAVTLYRRLRVAQDATHDADQRLQRAERRAEYVGGDEAGLRKLRARFAEALSDLADIRQQMKQVGLLKLPKLHKRWIEKMRELGIEEGS